ncbi:cell growth regulator with EF hand domain protein 1 isoform X2 [Mesocricetus auratus]|uniref:Cell growth regulator with EF hand domain protein 1 isoform X2 n=2 Tax=Mesocricetus auratus TaxID=10036 RepID=A0ABM2WEP1_MESAU|nr:cell growth regulator with EF hand domain protein 1 isoform X2 [Mesocricetus auratus]
MSTEDLSSEPQNSSPVSRRMFQCLMQVLMLPLLLLLPLGHAAPKDGAARTDPEVQQQLMSNPFQPGPEQLQHLRNYLKGLEKMEEDPEHMNREQVLLYLFALHDYDQNGQLDGLELLSMLTAALAPGAAHFPINPVILVVDQVLETQDLDGDGLMTPAELVNFPGEVPKHAESLPPALLEPQPAGRQSHLANGPLQPEAQQSLEARGQVEAQGESLEPVQKAGHQTEAEVDTVSPEGEVRRQAEAEGDVPSPREDAEGQVGNKDNEGEDREQPGETLDAGNTPNEVETHSIQLENDEI